MPDFIFYFLMILLEFKKRPRLNDFVFSPNKACYTMFTVVMLY